MAKVIKPGAQPPSVGKDNGSTRKLPVEIVEIPLADLRSVKANLAKKRPVKELVPALVHMGQVVYKARKEKNITQLQLAKLAGMNATSVFMFEAGRHNMNIKNIIALATALDLDLGDLVVRHSPSHSSKLKETADFLNETSGRISNQLRMMERFAAELITESEK